MTLQTGLEYRLEGARARADELWDDLADAGLGSMAGVSSPDRVTLYFDFSCGCEDCPVVETVEEARELIEGKLTEMNLDWTFVEEFDLDGDD